MLGKWTLIYFGFTNCPDICPEELDKMGGAVNALGTSWLCVSFGFGSLTCAAEKRYGTAIQPVFISVDPPRDTPARIASYLSEFHPRLVGLTGSYQDTKAVCKAYRVYFSTPPTAKADDDYLVDHSIFFYFMDPDGQFVDAFGKDTSMEAVVARVEKEIGEWEKDGRWKM
jgi:protein SCO1/2